jgi:hypothetical protein
MRRSRALDLRDDETLQALVQRALGQATDRQPKESSDRR